MLGGLHLALRRSDIPATVIEAYDWDPAGSEVYTENFGKGIVRRVW
jgi:tRNA (cytosine38-C5)-methyltransferase